MKRLTIIMLIIASGLLSYGQEFKIYSNGLMYSSNTMDQLEFIVDSLNIKFRACDLNKTYYSKYQAKAHYVDLDEGNIREAQKDMENNMSFEDFIEKYSESTIDKDLLVVKFKYKNYQDKNIVDFSSTVENYEIQLEESPEINARSFKGSWVFNYWEGDSYSDESIRGFYFTSEFEKQPIPEVYARMIQYSDCMVDTSSQVFREDAERTGVRYESKHPSKVSKFMKYVHRETNRPERSEDEDYSDYWARYDVWDSLRIPLIDSSISKQKKFSSLLDDAVEEALEKGGSDDEFEEYVGRYHSKEAELELKRGRIVVGGCSMDNRPRVHAMNIAVLSAQTVNWETFLRSHLDIMNDRFERASDGSYAWDGRKTYIKELEELDIDVTDLLFGISFRIENPSQNHYYGSIGRLGRALSETKFSNEIETRMLEMISDNSLDDYNRMVMYYLFLNYNYHLEDETKRKDNADKLEKAVEELPLYLAKKIE
ncbi:hypothetical protein [Salibacter halophilus]|uniref:Uncharacterized protein n=1 Tax=Salibacter halophilus TaxID=1803916 RepID=A0A6N6M7E0_9FLAO|nr:hypothetical protein [Salibacter halophilus]KAB1065980.1 hypothetical protein F3059_00470 [Salibacter halophilus]